MADVRVYAKQRGVGRVTDDKWTNLRATRDGAPIVLPWYQALVMEGVVYQAIAPPTMDNTGLTLMSTYADTSKTIFVDIPDSFVAIPVEMQATYLATGGAVDHVWMFVSETLNGVAGTETAITPRNLAMDISGAGQATAAHTASSEVDTVTGTERFLKRWASNQDLDATGIEPLIPWSIGMAGFAPIAMDASSLNLVMFATTSGTGFGFITWIELAESYIT